MTRPAKAVANLRDQGFRFVRRGAEFNWMPLELMTVRDLDCTDMSDAEFAVAVKEAA